MRPLYHAKADRLCTKADKIESAGKGRLAQLAERAPKQYELFRRSVAHVVMGLGSDTDEDTNKRIADYGAISDERILSAIATVMRQDAFSHRDLQTIDGRLANGMLTMAMGASTGCNTVYGSTPPNNPHHILPVFVVIV